MDNLIANSTFWEAISAIGTFLAVIVSLYLARPSKKPALVCHLSVTTFFKDEKNNIAEGDTKIVVTVKNIGDVPVAIVEAGFEVDRRRIDTTINSYKKSVNFPLRIKSGEIELIEYFISIQDSDYKYLVNLLERCKFTVKDSEENFYY